MLIAAIASSSAATDGRRDSVGTEIAQRTNSRNAPDVSIVSSHEILGAKVHAAFTSSLIGPPNMSWYAGIGCCGRNVGPSVSSNFS